MGDPRRGPTSDSRLRYAVDETPSAGLTLGLSLQVATVILTGIILIPIIVLNAADYPEGVEWAVFSALVGSPRITKPATRQRISGRRRRPSRHRRS